MTNVKLYLVFRTENNKTHNIIIDSPKADIDPLAIQETMNEIIQSDVFFVAEKGKLVNIEEAQYVERTITPVVFE